MYCISVTSATQLACLESTNHLCGCRDCIGTYRIEDKEKEVKPSKLWHFAGHTSISSVTLAKFRLGATTVELVSCSRMRLQVSTMQAQHHKGTGLHQRSQTCRLAQVLPQNDTCFDFMAEDASLP